jgi:hypothetical protein
MGSSDGVRTPRPEILFLVLCEWILLNPCNAIRNNGLLAMATNRSTKKRAKRTDDLEVVDSSGLMDADWAEINKLRSVYGRGGLRALNLALKKLAADPIRYLTVIGAFFPEMVRTN